MNYKNLYVVIQLKDKAEKFKVEECRKSILTGHNEALITLFNQKIWIDVYEVNLYRESGSVFCWKDHQEGKYVELNELNPVCPECGWWICNECCSCYCNKP